MDAGRLCRGDDRVRIRRILETRNILRHGAVEQFDVLRDIADMTAKGFRRPLIERGAVEPYRAARRGPDADQHARQRGFADAVGPITPSALPAVKVKLISCAAIFCTPGGATAALCTTSVRAGGLSAIGATTGGRCPSNLDRRCQPCRAAMKPRQLAMARSTGARARAPRIEPAMMIPEIGRASCR